MLNPVTRLRHRLGRTLRERVAGDDAEARAKLIWLFTIEGVGGV